MKRRPIIITAGLIATGAALLWRWCTVIYPAAATPSFVVVETILKPGDSSWTGVGPNPAGNYEVLPSGLPGGDVQLYFYAPYPTRLKVDIDGTTVPRFEDLPANSSAAAAQMSGFYRVLNVNSSFSPAIWTVDIRPSVAKASSAMYVINVADVSFNHLLTGTNSQSTPLSVKLVAQKSFILAITTSGQGQGSITSSPPGIACPPACAFDFGQSVTVNLVPNPDTSTSTFDGWSGSCSGFSNCQVTLNGTALGASAAFRLTSTQSNQNPNPCPAMSPPAGYSWFMQPYCPSQNAYNDPSPDLGCNSQMYFCCADSPGASQAAQGACNADQVQYPASCDYGNPNVLATPSGCYIKD